MCSDNVFFIIEWDFIKIDSKLQKLQPISPIYPNEKLVKFQKLWLLQNVIQLSPSPQSLEFSNKKSKMMHVLSLFRSAVITKEFYQKTFVIFLGVCNILGKNDNEVQVVQNFFWGV